jgi:hypothetical protein
MPDNPEAVPMLTALFDQLEAGHQAATTKPDPAELGELFAEFVAARMDY